MVKNLRMCVSGMREKTVIRLVSVEMASEMSDGLRAGGDLGRQKQRT